MRMNIFKIFNPPLMTEKAILLEESDLDIQGKKVRILFTPNFENSIYDIWSIDGRILFTGKVTEGKHAQIDMSEYSDGTYQLIIIDGDVLRNKIFRLKSNFSSEKN